jgi:hypothetical protein
MKFPVFIKQKRLSDFICIVIYFVLKSGVISPSFLTPVVQRGLVWDFQLRK